MARRRQPATVRSPCSASSPTPAAAASPDPRTLVDGGEGAAQRCAGPSRRSRSGPPRSARGPVLLAGPRSFCAGVERAIEVVERALEQRGAPVYVRRQIVHNAHVVGELEQRGAVFVEELDEVPDGATVVFSAHGVSPQVQARRGRRAAST